MHDIDIELKLMLNGKFAEARKISDKLQALGPEKIPDTEGKLSNPEIWIRHTFNRGWFAIQDGDYQAGCQMLESGRFINVYGSGPLKTNAPIYNPNEHDIKGKSIIISLEGGYGDEVIHARFVKSYKDLGASKVYLAASPELVSVFKRIEGVDGVILRNETHTLIHDYWVPGFSAGWIAGHTFDDFPNKPYLSALPESVETWKNIIKSDKLKVGIRWAGNPKFEHQQFRKFPPAFMTEELAKYDDIQIYSLQRDANIVDLPDNVIDLQHTLISWEDTLAAIMNLDIIITSCTSIAHVAAALGKKTWVMVPILPYHTWTAGAPKSNTSPYYGCVKLFRQKESGKWNQTFTQLYREFEKEYNLPKVEHTNHDRVTKKLNLGCGFAHLDGFVNVDYSDICQPDKVVDLNVLPWPFENDEFSHIVAKDVIEHLGGVNNVTFHDIIAEMYRVSENGAVWEVQVPHHRCDHAWDDPTHMRPITPTSFKMYDQKRALDLLKEGRNETPISIMSGIDAETVEVKFQFIDYWLNKVKEKEITEEQLYEALSFQNNVAEATMLLVQIHKPGRVTIEEVKQVVKPRKGTLNPIQ